MLGLAPCHFPAGPLGPRLPLCGLSGLQLISSHRKAWGGGTQARRRRALPLERSMPWLGGAAKRRGPGKAPEPHK